jgi:O-antigen/teichoic acid export membrane protein
MSIRPISEVSISGTSPGLQSTSETTGERPVAGLRSQFARGFAWTTAETYGSAAITFFFTAWLARLLSSHDFGLAAAASVVTLFFFVLVDSLSSTIVQHRDATREQISAAFWYSEVVLLTIYTVIFFAAPVAAAVTNAPELSGILRVAGLQLPILGMLLVPLALLRAALRFRELALCQIAGAIAAGALAVMAARAGYGYWALILQGLILIGVRATLIWWRSRFVPVLSARANDLLPLVRYSGGLAGFTTVNYWSRNMDILLIGRVFGAQSLGYYSLAFRLIGTPVQLVGGALRPLLHPTLVAMTGDQPRIRSAYLRVVRATALITFPLAALLWGGADRIVHLVWGPGWQPVADILRGLALLAAVQPVNSLSGAIYMTRGATGLLFKLSIFNAVVIIVAMLIGLPFGVTGVAVAISLAYALILAPLSSGIALVRLLDGSASQLVRALLPGLLVGIAVAGILLWATPMIP